MGVDEFPESRVQDLLARRDVEWQDVLRVVEVGSTAHGISSPDTGDDLDYTVVRIEPFDELVVGNPNRQSMMIRTQPEGFRSRMGDIDLQVYTLRKFAGLAAGGNPSILGAIFSPAVARNTIDFDQLGRLVAARRAGDAFLGYMQQQIERWLGIRGQKNVKRPELVDAYGFDTKYAAHVIRLGHQGIEYLETGRFTMPMPEPLRSQIVGLRTGSMDEYEALKWARDTEAHLKKAIADSPLPDRASRPAVDRWLIEHYTTRVPRNVPTLQPSASTRSRRK